MLRKVFQKKLSFYVINISHGVLVELRINFHLYFQSFHICPSREFVKTLKIQVKIYRLDSTRPHVITCTNCLHYTFLSVSFYFYLILFLICFSWMKILRAPVCKNQTKSKFRGKGGKFDFFYILMLDRLGYN